MMVLFTFSTLCHIGLVLSAPAPGLIGDLFGSDSSSSASTTVLSNATIESTLVRPALFARTSYCSAASVINWSCGPPCDALPGVETLLAGGDDGEIPGFFVAHDPTTQSIVVAHQGTDPSNLLSDLNDAEFALVSLNSTEFPSPPSGVKVHDGFQATHERTSSQILATVQAGLTSKNVNKVQFIGHSLGAAIAVMDAMFFSSQLGPGVQTTTTVFGLPRGGNPEWANFVDTTLGTSLTHVTNKEDPVPRVPPQSFGFQQPSGEVHINDDGSTVSCAGQENTNCADDTILSLSVANHLGPYFDGISMGGSACPA